MTSDETVFSALSALGLPIVNLARTGSINERPRVSTPFLMFGVDGGGEMYADDSVWAAIPRYRVQLLERTPDPGLEGRLTGLLRETFGPTKTYIDWSESEKARITSIYFSITHTD